METPVTPIWDPILALLKSRAFIALLVGALLDTLILVVPALLPVREELLNAVTLGILGIIAGIKAEDVAKKWGSDAADSAASGTTVAQRTAQKAKTPPLMVEADKSR